MGFTNGNNTWVGNLYRKFECMCQEVDDFITKDTVNYVGNQVQSVGDNMRRFYSDAVHDFLPPCDPVELEGQATGRKQSNAIAETESSLNNDGDATICRSSNLSFKESMTMVAHGSHSSDSTSSESLPSSLHDVGYAIAETESSLNNDGDATICRSSNLSFKENMTMVAQGSHSSDNTSSESLQSSLHDVGFAIAETESSLNNGGDAAICRSSHLSFKESMTMGEQRSHSSDNTSSEYLRSSLHGVGPTTVHKDETLSKSFSDDPNLLLSSQIILKGDFIKEVKIVTEELGSTEYQNSSTSQLLSASLLETDHRTSLEDEMVTNRDVTEFVSEGSSMLVEQFVTGASEDELKHGCQLNQLTALVSSVETDPCMEKIDLSGNEKLDFSCVQVDRNKPLNTVSSGPRRFKSYKKLIQDALASRKKLVTEYKLLAIWYGDTDTESCQHSMDSPATVPATSLHSKKSQSCKCCESGWELL